MDFGKRCLLLFGIVNCFILSQVFGAFTSELRLLYYQNPTGRDYGGSLCDPLSTGCDTYFKFCVVYPATSNPSSSSSCFYRVGRSSEIESNYINFQTDNTGINRVTTVFGHQWLGSIGFYMEAKDHDHASGHDLIDQHSWRKTFTPGANGSVTSYRGTSYGLRPSYKTTVTFNVKVSCLFNYYGSDCMKYCHYTDDATHGHFRCDRNGDRICLPGWYNNRPNGNCMVYCMPQDDDVNGHYTCDSTTGFRICRANWYVLPKCLKGCVPRNDINGHFNCDSNGTRVCRDDWYNLPNCTTYCKPQNDTHNGHYACHPDSGRRVCHAGWYGDSCNMYCRARNDDANGHYNCSKNGTKICHSDWYGTNCARYCKPSRDDTLGHYNCSSSNGRKLCLENYYGENCTTHCVIDTGDNTSRHYVCDEKTGEKKCDVNWTGVFCNVSIVILTSSSSSLLLPIASSKHEMQTPMNATTSLHHTTTARAVPASANTVYLSMRASASRSFAASPAPPLSSLSLSFTQPLVVATSPYRPVATKASPRGSSTAEISPFTTATSSQVAKTTEETYTSVTATTTGRKLDTELLGSATSSSKLPSNTLSTSMHSSTHLSSTASVKSRQSTSSKLQLSASSTAATPLLKQTSTTATLRPSKSTTTSSPTSKTKTIKKSTHGRKNPKGVDWLLQTDDGKILLGGSVFAFVLLAALFVAVVMYFRVPKRPRENAKMYKKDIDNNYDDDDDDDEFGVVDLMQNACINPLYEDDPVTVAKVKMMELKAAKKFRSSKKHDVYYEKPAEPTNTAPRNDIATEESSYSTTSNVIHNPLYAAANQFQRNETGV